MRIDDVVSSRTRFGILCLAAYVALAWAVRFDMTRGTQIASLVYPLDTFSMYARVWRESVSLLLVREASGRIDAVTSFTSFTCDEPPSVATTRCQREQSIAYHDDDLIRYVERHAGDGSEEVELIRRVWSLRPLEPPRAELDCVVTRCRVRR